MDEIQKIVFEIADRCQRRKVPVTDMLAAFVAKTIILENPDKFQLDRAMSQDDVEGLVSMAVTRLSKEDDPSLETLRMQVAFDAAYVERQEALEKDKAGTNRAYSLLEQSICATTLASTKDVAGMGQMHRLIIAALLTRTGQNPSNEVFQREVAAALESVLPRANLYPFTALDYADKRDRLVDLHNYVLGIRLFNKALGKGGSGLGDKIRDASEQVLALGTSVMNQLGDAEKIVNDTQAVINFAHKKGEKASTSKTPLQRLHDELAYRRQYIGFLQSFEQEIATSQEQMHNIALDYDAHMEELRELVGRKSAVPKERVYPLFEGLSKLWMEAKDVEMHNGALQAIFDELVTFTIPNYKTMLLDEDVSTAYRDQEGEEAKPGGEAAAAVGEGAVGEGEKRTEITAKSGEDVTKALDPASTTPLHVFKNENPEVIAMPIEFGGFCPTTMTERDGLLLPSDPTNGNILYQGKLYGFVSMDALLAFKEDPGKFLGGVLGEARKKPELINLLHLDRHFPHHVLRKVLAGLTVEGAVGLAKVMDGECQTPTHFVERHIDPKYDWNEWSLRRKAIQLANLHTKRTHATQTQLSQYRRENDAQVYLPKGATTQTAVDRGTRPTMHFQFVKGLRGHPDQEMQVVK
eukprot:CAMPEP_0174929332 /NCGR_PEP_ID=MMETSP1355-20121228/27143_1 /TAXON_ID=464990 /ORGANISM="Hemiselmis tepida, Strain CCMP443" /LENGTH=635 /DNA_ID=CAMNT_0016175527 /DNA_START=27 /DNA_END=1931 /DNA_ORIENTATION=-